MNDMAAGPRLRPFSESTFPTHDGVDLFYRHWPAIQGPARGAIVLFHRGHEHSARMAHLVDELALPDFDFFAWDARGHGRSPGARGDSPSFGTSVRDVQTFVDHISTRHGIAAEDIGVIAQSVGAVQVATWVHDYAPAIRGMVLASPAFRVKLYVPFALPGLALMRKLVGNFFVKSYVRAKFLTHDPARIASYETDPLLSRSISVNVLLGLQEAADRVVADAQAITVPTQLLVSGADWVVRHAPQHAFFDRLGAREKERHVLHGFLHDTLGELDRARVVDRVRAFLVRSFAAPRARVNLLDADRHGPTCEEADALAAPLPRLSPRGVYWAATRASLRFGGMLADGIRLGHDTGFDSGSTLDYIYRNQANGRTPLGRWIDRTYLDAIGWRGVRQRKLDVEALLREAIARLRDSGAPVRIVDVAAGHGRYVLDAVAALPDAPGLHRAARLQRAQPRAWRGADRGARALGHRAIRARRCLRPRELRRAVARVHARHRLGPLRARAGQRARAPIARRARRRDRPERLPRLHRAAVASAARADRARADQPSPRRRLGDAPAHAGGARPARRRGGLPQDRAADRRIGDLHRVARAARGRMRASAAVETWPWRRALAWLAFLGPFFFLTYGLANWSASQRADVPSLAFGWESGIPFWQWTILPYWTIDLLYGLSLFVCTTQRELGTHARRLLTAQLIAIGCFVAAPLRFSFSHPAADGVWGDLFAVLAGFDRPYNQMPSLHIALAVILWAIYARRIEGVARLAMDAWFALICVSALTTYQHHFIDIPTGFLLGMLCLWAWPFPEEGDGRPIATQWRWTRDPQRWRIAAVYAAVALLLGATALHAGGAALWLLWGSVSLLLVAFAYAALGAAAFQKGADGRLSIAARWLFAPYLAGAWLNSRAWTWRDKEAAAVGDGVFFGRVPTQRELAASPFTGVVDVTAEFDLRRGDRELAVVPMLDLVRPNALALAQAAQAIERLRASGPVLVCCALGYSRSACAVAAWLLASGRARDVDAALAAVRGARAGVVLDAGHAAALGGLCATDAGADDARMRGAD